MATTVKMSLLASQPDELLVAQMMFLDLASLKEMCQVSPLTRSICSSDWFWRGKISHDFPDYSFVYEGRSPRKVYEVLTQDSPFSALRLDLSSVFSYLAKERLSDPLFVEQYIALATVAGNKVILELLLNNIEGSIIFLFLYLKDWQLVSLNERERKRFEETVRWMYGKGVLGPWDDVNVAIVLGDYEMLGFERPAPVASRYGLRFGSEDIVLRLLHHDSTLEIYHRIPIDRLPLLISLGARMTEFPYPDQDPDYFYELVDAGYIEINAAIAAVLRTDKEDFYESDRSMSKESLLYRISTVDPDAITEEKVRESLLAYYEQDEDNENEDNEDEDNDYIQEMMEELAYII